MPDGKTSWSLLEVTTIGLLLQNPLDASSAETATPSCA